MQRIGIYRSKDFGRLTRTVALATSALVLAACGTVQGERMRAPNYASPLGTDRWEVVCGRDRIIIDDDSLEQFYNADGSVKEYLEFCRENEAGIIPRPGP